MVGCQVVGEKLDIDGALVKHDALSPAGPLNPDSPRLQQDEGPTAAAHVVTQPVGPGRVIGCSVDCVRTCL